MKTIYNLCHINKKKPPDSWEEFLFEIYVPITIKVPDVGFHIKDIHEHFFVHNFLGWALPVDFFIIN